jgi:hypothetical protein
MAGFGVIFPFFYFSKLVKNKSKEDKILLKEQKKEQKMNNREKSKIKNKPPTKSMK